MLKANHIGEYGFKIDEIFSDQVTDTDLSSVLSFSLKSVLASYPNPQTGEQQTETTWDEVVERMINAWRWWADSYGYFHRKNDSVIFGHELSFLLKSGIIQPKGNYWQNLGLRQTYNLREEPTAGSVYIDPDTNNILPTRDRYTHPQLFDNLERPFSIDIDLKKIPSLTPEKIAHVARITMLAMDIAITISSYPNQQLAAQMVKERPVHFDFKNGSSEQSEIVEFLHWAMRTSSESIQFLGKTETKNTFALEFGNQIGNKTSQLAASISTVRTNGVRNLISWQPELVLAQVEKAAGVIVEEIQETANDKETIVVSGVPLRGTPESAQDTPEKEPRTAAKPPKTKSGTSWQLNSITKPFQTQSGLQVYLTFIPATFQVLVASDEPSRLAELDSPSFQMFVHTLRIILQYNLPVAELQQLANIGDNPETIELQNIICQQIHAFQPAQPGE